MKRRNSRCRWRGDLWITSPVATSSGGASRACRSCGCRTGPSSTEAPAASVQPVEGEHDRPLRRVVPHSDFGSVESPREVPEIAPPGRVEPRRLRHQPRLQSSRSGDPPPARRSFADGPGAVLQATPSSQRLTVGCRPTEDDPGALGAASVRDVRARTQLSELLAVPGSQPDLRIFRRSLYIALKRHYTRGPLKTIDSEGVR